MAHKKYTAAYKQYAEKLFQKLQKHSPTSEWGENADAVFKKLATYDPTHDFAPQQQYTYLAWLARTVIKNNVRPQDVYKLRDDLDIFRRYQKDLKDAHGGQVPNIDSIKTPDALYRLVKPFYAREEKRQNRPEKTDEVINGTTLIYQGEEGKIISVTNKEASIYYGQNTRWCISATDSDNYFDYYYRNGKQPIYMFLPSRGHEKYAFSTQENMFRNSADDEIGIVEFFVDSIRERDSTHPNSSLVCSMLNKAFEGPNGDNLREEIIENGDPKHYHYHSWRCQPADTLATAREKFSFVDAFIAQAETILSNGSNLLLDHDTGSIRSIVTDSAARIFAFSPPLTDDELSNGDPTVVELPSGRILRLVFGIENFDEYFSGPEDLPEDDSRRNDWAYLSADDYEFILHIFRTEAGKDHSLSEELIHQSSAFRTASQECFLHHLDTYPDSASPDRGVQVAELMDLLVDQQNRKTLFERDDLRARDQINKKQFLDNLLKRHRIDRLAHLWLEQPETLTPVVERNCNPAHRDSFKENIKGVYLSRVLTHAIITPSFKDPDVITFCETIANHNVQLRLSPNELGLITKGIPDTLAADPRFHSAVKAMIDPRQIDNIPLLPENFEEMLANGLEDVDLEDQTLALCLAAVKRDPEGLQDVKPGLLRDHAEAFAPYYVGLAQGPVRQGLSKFFNDQRMLNRLRFSPAKEISLP